MKNSFIQLLNEQVSQNDNPLNTNLNIHFCLRGEIVKYCLDLNSEIQKITESQIDFRPQSFHVPHMTLVRGFVTSNSEFESFVYSLYNLAGELSPIEIICKNPYRSPKKTNYILIEIDNNQLVQSLIKNVKDKIKNCFNFFQHSSIKETAHITVAYVTDEFAKIEKLTKNYAPSPKWLANAIEISFAGLRGTCLGTIRSFEFGKLH